MHGIMFLWIFCINGWHNLWPTILFRDNEAEPDFDGFRVSHDKKLSFELFKHAKGLSCEEVKMSEESDNEECLNVDSDAPGVQ